MHFNFQDNGSGNDVRFGANFPVRGRGRESIFQRGVSEMYVLFHKEANSFLSYKFFLYLKNIMKNGSSFILFI